MLITTLEQLDALPVRARIAIDDGDDILTQVAPGEWVGGPYKAGDQTWVGLPEDPEEYLPVTCIYMPPLSVDPQGDIALFLDALRPFVAVELINLATTAGSAAASFDPMELVMPASRLHTRASELTALRDRCCPSAYRCPTNGETECLTHGRFDTCCNHPDCPGSTDRQATTSGSAR